MILLKGRRVLLEKEHYAEIMEKYLDICKNYMLFLCKDEEYQAAMVKNEDEDGLGMEEQVDAEPVSPLDATTPTNFSLKPIANDRYGDADELDQDNI